MSRVSFSAAFVLLLFQNCERDAQAAPVGYSFSGSVKIALPSTPPYGIPIAKNAPFSGHFYYDPNTSPIGINGYDAAIYPQAISNGFTATIGSVSVTTDSYAVEVFNDYPSGSTTIDQLKIIYWSGLTTSPPTSPLVVNGTPHWAGKFEIDLTAPSSFLSGPQLPQSLNLSDYSFSAPASLFDDESPPGATDVFLTVTSLTAIPVLTGDLNRDGKVDASDIPVMMQLLADPNTYEKAYALTDSDLLTLGDLNHSNGIDNADLQNLLNTLRGGGNLVPEPSTLCLLLVASGVTAACTARKRRS